MCLKTFFQFCGYDISESIEKEYCFQGDINLGVILNFFMYIYIWYSPLKDSRGINLHLWNKELYSLMTHVRRKLTTLTDVNITFLFPLKSSKNRRFSDVFRGKGIKRKPYPELRSAVFHPPFLVSVQIASCFIFGFACHPSFLSIFSS